MAKTLIGNVKGKNGRGIVSIKKTGTTGPVDTYTITYTDDTTSTFTVNNSDDIALQRQIVPSAAVESSDTASQSYAAGDYVVVNGILRKVKGAIAKGNAISDSNSTAATVTGELANLARMEDSVSRDRFEQDGVVAERFGKVVTLVISTGDLSISDSWGTTDVCVLPWKPTCLVNFSITLQGGLQGVIGIVSPEGSLEIRGKDTEWRNGWLFGSVSYVCV